MGNTEQLDELDRIERSIDIDASAERVWSLVTRPGWYVNTGTVDEDPQLSREGDLDVLTHPEYGVFRFSTEKLDEPAYAAFRWIGEPNDDQAEPSTLVEFWIDERAGGGVTLRVVESGFSRLGKDRAEWLKQREENVEGWEKELAAAKTYVES